MKLGMDFFIHWLWAIVFAILTISGIALIGARFAWVIDYNLALADYIHRIGAILFLVLFALAICHVIWTILSKKNNIKLIWSILGNSGYALFNLYTSILLILSGVVLWANHDDKVAVAFAMFVHEQLTYIVIGGAIWHIYQKAHALLWAKSPNSNILVQASWYKAFVWFISSVYFYCTAVMMVSLAGPSPSSSHVMKFMSGMMNAMKNSLMGRAAMEGSNPEDVISLSVILFFKLLPIAFLAGAYYVWKESSSDESR